MKKFKSIKKLETSKLVDFKLKKANLYQLKGGATCGSRSVCHIDGSDEGDCANLSQV